MVRGLPLVFYCHLPFLKKLRPWLLLPPPPLAACLQTPASFCWLPRTCCYSCHCERALLQELPHPWTR